MGIARCHEPLPGGPWKMSVLVAVIILNPLFWIIRGISEYPWVNPAFDPVMTCDNNSISHRMDEVIIQHVLPDGLHELAAAMGHQLLSLGLPVWVPTRNPTFERVRKLWNISIKN